MIADQLTAATEQTIARNGGLNASLIRDSLEWLNDRGQAESIDPDAFLATIVFHPHPALRDPIPLKIVLRPDDDA